MTASDILILVGVILGSSCLASLSIARRLGASRPLSEVERARIELDAVLDGLDLAELEQVEEYCRDLHRRREKEREAAAAVRSPAVLN